jgi:hypothetical protein
LEVNEVRYTFFKNSNALYWQLEESPMIPYTILLCSKFKTIYTTTLMIWLESWFSKNNLFINTDKAKAMLFQLNKPYDMTEQIITLKNMKITYRFSLGF